MADQVVSVRLVLPGEICAWISPSASTTSTRHRHRVMAKLNDKNREKEKSGQTNKQAAAVEACINVGEIKQKCFIYKRIIY
jgi:hypothetical protein